MLAAIIPILSCDFEGATSPNGTNPGSLCYYTQNTDDNFDWILQKGNTASFSTGPDADHTFSNLNGEKALRFSVAYQIWSKLFNL